VLPWTRVTSSLTSKSVKDELDTKYPFVCHAEMNAILNKSNADIRGSRIYVVLFPCNECAKMIIQSGIREVIFVKDTYHETNSYKAARLMFDFSGVSIRRYMPIKKEIIISFT